MLSRTIFISQQYSATNRRLIQRQVVSLTVGFQPMRNHFARTTLLFSTASSPVKATSRFQRPSAETWRRIAHWIRYTRIPILVASVYSLGYQQGVMECTRTPQALQANILQTILVSVGARDPKQVQIVNERDISYTSSRRDHQVAAVGHKIIQAARAYVREQLEIAMQRVKAKLPQDITDQDAMVFYEQDSNVSFWLDARTRLQGEDVQSVPWQYIFIETPSPNAFVTEILPQRFFITTSMLEIAATPDELGVILGHEISHLLLGHVGHANKLEMILRTLEVLFLSIDPTAGLLAIAVIATLATIRTALTAAYSRENEREADELGIKIAARACFDTLEGSKVMQKMHQHNVASATPISSTKMRLMDTHPPSLERYERLKHLAENENPRKYDDCASMTSRLLAAVWRSASSSSKNN